MSARIFIEKKKEITLKRQKNELFVVGTTCDQVRRGEREPFDSFHQRIVQFYESYNVNYCGEINLLYDPQWASLPQPRLHLYLSLVHD